MQGLRFAIVVLVSIWSLLGSGEFARASDLKLNFVNSNTKAPYFPITEMKVSQTKIGGKVASQVKFEYTDKIGEKKRSKFYYTKRAGYRDLPKFQWQADPPRSRGTGTGSN
jgi:hypothetical protein